MGRQQRGYSLIEMAITLTIVSIITLVALNIYTSQARQGRRVDGVNTLLSMSLAEERYRASNTTYGSLAQVWGGVTTSPEGYYTLSISSTSGTGYTLRATASGNQASDSQDGTSCTTLTLTMSNGTITKSPSTCWPK